MNGIATFGDQIRAERTSFALHNPAPCCYFRARGNDDQRDDGLWNCGRRYLAGLLRPDDATAEPPGKSPVGRPRFRNPMARLLSAAMAEAFSIGAAATPRPIVLAIRSIQAGAIPAEEAATAAGAINAVLAAERRSAFDPTQHGFLDSF